MKALTLDHVPAHDLGLATGASSHESEGRAWYTGATDWHAMCGRHVKTVSNDLYVSSQRLPVLLLAFVMEGIELVTSWYFKAGTDGHLADGDVPPLFDLLWLEKSPATVTMVFFSTCLTGRHRVVKCLANVARHKTLIDLQQCAPSEAHRIRTVLVSGSFWVWVRHVHRIFQWPYPLCITADKRRSLEDRKQVCLDFGGSCQWCFDAWHGRKVHAEIKDPEELLEEPWQQTHSELARTSSLTNHESELEHARTGKTCTSQTAFAFASARACCRQASGAMAWASHVSDAPQIPGSDAPVSEDYLPPLCKTLELWWHSRCLQRDKVKISKETRAAYKNEWSDLPPLQQDQLRAQYEAESQAAMSARKAKSCRVAKVKGEAQPAPQCAKKPNPIQAATSYINADAYVAFSQLHGKDRPRKISGLNVLEEDWIHRCSTCAMDRGSVPKVVPGSRMCRGVCPKKFSVEQRRACHGVCKGTRQRLTKCCGGVLACKRLEVVLWFGIVQKNVDRGGDEFDDFHYAVINDLIGGGVSGIMRTAEGVIPLEISDDCAAQDMLEHDKATLRFKRGPAVRVRECAPFTSCEHLTSGQNEPALAHTLLHEWLPVILPSDVASVTVRRLRFNWRQGVLDELQLDGWDNTFPELVVLDENRVEVDDEDEEEVDFSCLKPSKKPAWTKQQVEDDAVPPIDFVWSGDGLVEDDETVDKLQRAPQRRSRLRPPQPRPPPPEPQSPEPQSPEPQVPEP